MYVCAHSGPRLPPHTLALCCETLTDRVVSRPVCKLVVAFHGCEMDIPTIKDAYYVHSGLNQWAETNNVPYSTMRLADSPSACLLTP